MQPQHGGGICCRHSAGCVAPPQAGRTPGRPSQGTAVVGTKRMWTKRSTKPRGEHTHTHRPFGGHASTASAAVLGPWPTCSCNYNVIKYSVPLIPTVCLLHLAVPVVRLRSCAHTAYCSDAHGSPPCSLSSDSLHTSHHYQQGALSARGCLQHPRQAQVLTLCAQEPAAVHPLQLPLGGSCGQPEAGGKAGGRDPGKDF